MKNTLLSIVLTSPLFLISGGIFKTTSYDYFKVENILYSVPLFALSFIFFHIGSRMEEYCLNKLDNKK